MKEDSYRTWDMFTKITTIIVSLVALYVGYRNFIDEYELDNRQPYIETTMKYYIEMVETVSKVAHPINEADRQLAIVRFKQLYVGASALVEDSEVEEQVNQMDVCIGNIGRTCDQVELRARALLLANACRKSLVRLWRLDEAKEG